MSTREGAQAEIALLKALLERASGREDVEAANHALSLTRAFGKEDWVREAHVLLAELHRASGNVETARMHIDQAVTLRDQVADALHIPAKAKLSEKQHSRRPVKQDRDKSPAMFGIAKHRQTSRRFDGRWQLNLVAAFPPRPPPARQWF